MDRGEATGFGVALAGHAALLGVLSLGFATVRQPIILSPPMEVAFVDEVGLQAAVSEAQTEAPAEAQAPEVGPPEEASPAELPEPTPAPTPPRPTPPAPTPTPAPPAPRPEPAPPEPKPVPKPAAKPAPAKPSPPKAAAKPAPARPAPAKAAPAKAQPKQSADSGSGSAPKSRASRLGSDFLKGIAEPSPGKAATPRAAVSSRDMAGLAQAIAAQVRPCYVPPSGGSGAEQIQTVLRIRFNQDGRTASAPTVVEQNGVNGDNRSYARQMGDAAKRAVLRCSPLRLPSELYEGGWEDIEFNFNPRAMG